LWNSIQEAGEEFDLQAYGTEALHVLRAEVGFIMIGDESDGTVTPQDLGLSWAISRKKKDFLGKRAQERSFLAAPDRWRLVGLQRLGGKSPLPHGAYCVANETVDFGHRRMIGRVTSTYYSPILDEPIALGLLENGPERLGTVVEFVHAGGKTSAKVVEPVFYKPAVSARD